MKNKISVIIPVYNCEKTIKRCIDSIIQQDYTNFEILLIDDGSKDGSAEICKCYQKNDNRIKYYFKKNSGPSATRNYGLNKAVGEYIIFIDSDDFIEKKMFSILINNVSDKVDVVRCLYYTFDGFNKKKFFYKGPFGVFSSKSIIEDHMLNSILWNPVWGQLIRKSFAVNIKFNENIRIGEDLLYNFNLYNTTNNICIINEHLYTYYYNKNSITKLLSEKSIKTNINNIIDNYSYFYNFYDSSENKSKISERGISSVMSYELQLLFVNYKNNINYLKNEINKSPKLIRLLKKYKKRKYKLMIFSIKSNNYLFFNTYYFLYYLPLKFLKEKLLRK